MDPNPNPSLPYTFLSNLASFARDNPGDTDGLARWLTNQVGSEFRRSSGNSNAELTPDSVTKMASMETKSRNTQSFQPIVQVTHAKDVSQGKCLILSDGHKYIPALIKNENEECSRLVEDGVVGVRSIVVLKSFQRSYKKSSSGDKVRPAIQLHEIEVIRSKVSTVIGNATALDNDPPPHAAPKQQEEQCEAASANDVAMPQGEGRGSDASSSGLSNSDVLSLLSKCKELATKSPRDPDVLAKLWSDATGGRYEAVSKAADRLASPQIVKHGKTHRELVDYYRELHYAWKAESRRLDAKFKGNVGSFASNPQVEDEMKRAILWADVYAQNCSYLSHYHNDLSQGINSQGINTCPEPPESPPQLSGCSGSALTSKTGEQASSGKSSVAMVGKDAVSL